MWFIQLTSRHQLLLRRMASSFQSVTPGRMRENSSWLLITERKRMGKAMFGLQSHQLVPRVSYHCHPLSLVGCSSASFSGRLGIKDVFIPLFWEWHVCQAVRMELSTSFRSWFSPSTIRVPGTEFRLLGFTANAFTHWAVSQALTDVLGEWPHSVIMIRDHVQFLFLENNFFILKEGLMWP